MEDHPIQGLMNTAMNNIRDMVDVDTIVGEPIQSVNGTTIIPVSKVCFGFAAGGSEFKGETLNQYSRDGTDEDIEYRLPFGGGSGAGVNISPVGFLVICENTVKFLPVDHCSALDKLLDYVPDLIEKVADIFYPEYKYEIYDDIDDDEEDEEHDEIIKENEEKPKKKRD